MALAGMKKDIVKIKLKLRKDEELTEIEDATYLSYFAVSSDLEKINIINTLLEC